MTTHQEYVTKGECVKQGKLNRYIIGIILTLMSFFLALLMYATSVASAVGEKYDTLRVEINEISKTNVRQEEINKNIIKALEDIKIELNDQKKAATTILAEILKSHEALLAEQKKSRTNP